MIKVEEIHSFFAIISAIHRKDVENEPHTISFSLYFDEDSNIDFDTIDWLVSDIGNGKKILEKLTEQMVEDRMKYLSSLN